MIIILWLICFLGAELYREKLDTYFSKGPDICDDFLPRNLSLYMSIPDTKKKKKKKTVK